MDKWWIVPKLWPDSRVFIIGGGPSLKNVPLDILRNKRVIGANNSFMFGDWVDVCWFVDSVWYEDNKVRLEEFPGLKIHCCNRHADRPGTLRIMRSNNKFGIEKDPSKISWNMCSGSSAINLAYHLGAKSVVLLGFDMKINDNGENNWHNLHRPKPKKWNPYRRFLDCFPTIKSDAKSLGLEILNATPDSALTIFPMIKLEDAL
jgi:hypothetical protein